MTESEELLPNSKEFSISRHLSDGLTALDPEGEMPKWQREIAGMYISIGFIEKKANDPSKPGFTAEDIFAINKAVMNDPLNPHFYGVLRRVPILEVASTVRGERRISVIEYPLPEDLTEEFGSFSEKIEQKTQQIDSNTPIAEVLDTASWAHDGLVSIHPFRDGNGRTARLLVDFIFKRAGLSYITDWGAKNDEYKDVVDRRFRNGNPNIFKGFLARKLLKRTFELEKKHPNIKDVLTTVQGNVQTYLYGINANAA